ncbi:MAG: hypothetical protein AB8B79_05050 [Granulosicoccus sp.]
MNLKTLVRLVACVVTIMLMSACSSSSDPVPADSDVNNGQQLGDQPGEVPPETPGNSDIDIPDPQDQDDPANQPPENEQNQDPLDPQDQGDPVNQPPQNEQNQDPPQNEQNQDPLELPDQGNSNEPDVLVPDVTPGSDLDRLIEGVSQQASRTILGLSQLLSEGADLSDQQSECLGAYDPGLGETLTAVSCERPLATGDIALYVGEAAFFNTSACRSSLFNGSAMDCQLQRASVTIRTEWIIPDPSLPPQPIPGMQINYALEDEILRIENTEDMLSGAFRCDIQLTTAQVDMSLGAQSCDSLIESAANRLETLLAGS